MDWKWIKYKTEWAENFRTKYGENLTPENPEDVRVLPIGPRMTGKDIFH